MAGVLESGDKVIVNVADRAPSPPGIFILWDGLGRVAKRLEYLEEHDPPLVRIMSEQPRYRTYERTPGEVNIVGRVVGVWRRV